MSIYTQYADGVRAAHTEWEQIVDGTTEASKRLAAASTTYVTTVLDQWDDLAQAANDYLVRSQKSWREQVGEAWDAYGQVVARAKAAVTDPKLVADAA